MQYRRLYQAGAWYFFTVVIEKRKPLLVEHIERLRTAFRLCLSRYPFAIEAMVVLPDHLHTLWKLPEGDADFSKRWMVIKRKFSSGLPKGAVNASMTKKREKGIWQRRYWEHLIRDENDLKRHVDYIHYNPVKHGLATKPGDWEFSSFQRYVTKGLYRNDWGDTEPLSIEGIDIE